MTKAAITPGTQPQIHSKKTIKIEPQPLPITDKGGKMMARSTLQKLILLIFLMIDVTIGRKAIVFVTSHD